MANNDTEFDFDCPQFSYDLNASDCRDEEEEFVDSWFLTYHPEHDWKGPSQVAIAKEKSSLGTSSSSGAGKSSSSHLGPARSAKRMSTTSNVTSSSHGFHSSVATQSSSVSKRRSSRGDDLRAEDSKHPVKEKGSHAAIGLKRKSASKDNLDDVGAGHAATTTDMRDKLDEFRQRKKKEMGAEISAVISTVKSVPPTDYSRSKILATEAIRSAEVAVTSTAAQLARAKLLAARVNKTSTGVQSYQSAISSNSSSVSSNSLAPRSSIRTVAPPSPRVAAKSSSSASGSSRQNQKDSKSSAAIDTDESMMELLKKHNKKFAPVPIYEPSRHSVRDVRKWEKSSGKTWATLGPEDRETANAEIKSKKDAELRESQR